MTAAAIRVEGLTKLYRIGLRDRRPETLAGYLLQMAKRPMANFRRLRELGSVTEADADNVGVIAALRNVSFEVGAGEVLGVIGINGAGKSTLLKVLCGVCEPTSGWAEINGRTAGLLEVGTGFHPELTGRENVYLNGAILGMNRAETDRNFDDIVAFSGVEPFIDTPVKRYSSGMKVRLAFAVAAHLEPEILLIDEVLAVGDAVFQQQCIDRMAALASSGRTLLLVSHNLGTIRRLCTTGLLLDAGSVLAHGPIGDVLGTYAAITRRCDHKDTNNGGIHVGLPRIKVPGNELRRMDPFVVEAPIEIRDVFWHVVIQIGMNTVDGRILVLSSTDSDRHPELVTPGVIEVFAKVPPLWLSPLAYPLRIKVIATSPKGQERRFYSPWINVDVGGEPGIDVHPEALLAPDVGWEITPMRRASRNPESDSVPTDAREPT